ncbi:hypothetical protein [Bordetella flabilis]|uniref:ParB/Sulfiredoxin domain-containing protein n=1 Tax=Bordetella flabilis TaxID=463014 RepID=A0A193GNC7_9BORD|nr:hypothetical protein [Bordetella flabilis]ANN80874.1 hypothetical protein BAU07_26500 [Bordetella flabilis]
MASSQPEKSRSLKSMAADTNIPGVKKNDLYRIDPRLVEEEEGFNLRDYDDPEVIAHIEGFAQSYMAGNFVPPWIVRTDGDGRILVVEGHCRRRGALLAIERGAELPFVDTVPFRGNESDRVHMMLKSNDGLKFKPLKIAEGYLRLHRNGHSNVDIARKQLVTPARVEQMLLLATAEPDVHQLVRDGVVTADVAIEAVRKYREKAGAFLRGEYEKAVAQGKAKVTRSTMRGPTLPPKVVGSVVTALRGAVESFDSATRRRLAAMEKKNPEDLKGERIEVDALTLLNLVRATAEIKEAEAKIASRKRDSAQAASQQELGVDNGE